jgi:hypothetical protein
VKKRKPTRYTGARLKKLKLTKRKPPKRKPLSRPKLRATLKLPSRSKWSFDPKWSLDGPMGPKEYSAALKKLGLTTASQRTAKAIGHNVRQCQRFVSGDAVVPPSVARLLRMYLKFGLSPD